MDRIMVMRLWLRFWTPCIYPGTVPRLPIDGMTIRCGYSCATNIKSRTNAQTVGFFTLIGISNYCTSRSQLLNNTIGRVRLNVRLLNSCSWTNLTFGLEFYRCIGHRHSSLETESWGQRSRSRVRVRVSKDDNAVGLTAILDRRHFVVYFGHAYSQSHVTSTYFVLIGCRHRSKLGRLVLNTWILTGIFTPESVCELHFRSVHTMYKRLYTDAHCFVGLHQKRPDGRSVFRQLTQAVAEEIVLRFVSRLCLFRKRFDPSGGMGGGGIILQLLHAITGRRRSRIQYLDVENSVKFRNLFF